VPGAPLSPMPLDPSLYTGRHRSPQVEAGVEVVAYELKAGGWHAFVFEPPGVCPDEWEAARADPQHLFLGVVKSLEELESLAGQVRRNLGAGYDLVLAFQEAHPGVRGGVNVRLHRLHKAGCTGYRVVKREDGRFEMWVRRKDLAIAS
jgi:hypothetical protein